MTTDQVKEAIEQMKVQCNLKMANYEMVSARSVLHELGYSEEEADEVIYCLAEGGFSYCVDPLIRVKALDNPKKTEIVEYSVCFWGPDQLKSRLHCVRIS